MNILVFNTDPVATLDIAGHLRGTWPDVIIEVAMDLPSAFKALDGFTDLAMAFINMPLDKLGSTGLVSAVENKQGKIVLSHFGGGEIGKRISDHGWVPLASPFTNLSIKEALISAGFPSR